MKVMSLGRWSRTKVIVRIMALLLLLVLVWLLIRNWPNAVSHIYGRPLISQGKDWLDVFAAFGQGFGLIALFALFLEVLRRRDEIARRHLPRLKADVSAPLTTLPAANVQCFSEDSAPRVSQDSTDDGLYKYFWEAARSGKGPYVRITISNESTEPEGVATDVRIQVRLTYSMTQKPNPSVTTTDTLWLPLSEVTGPTISSSAKTQFAIKLGMKDYNFVEVHVVDVRCLNHRGTALYGAKVGFSCSGLPITNYVEMLEGPQP